MDMIADGTDEGALIVNSIATSATGDIEADDINIIGTSDPGSLAARRFDFCSPPGLGTKDNACLGGAISGEGYWIGVGSWQHMHRGSRSDDRGCLLQGRKGMRLRTIVAVVSRGRDIQCLPSPSRSCSIDVVVSRGRDIQCLPSPSRSCSILEPLDQNDEQRNHDEQANQQKQTAARELFVESHQTPLIVSCHSTF